MFITYQLMLYVQLDGRTTMERTRRLNTGDDDDWPITPHVPQQVSYGTLVKRNAVPRINTANAVGLVGGGR